MFVPNITHVCALNFDGTLKYRVISSDNNPRGNKKTLTTFATSHHYITFKQNTSQLLVGDDNAVVALAAVKAVVVLGHHDTRATLFLWARLAKALHLITVDLVVLEDGEFDVLVLVLDLLWLGVGLLLALLTAATKTEDQMQSCLFLDV